MMINVNSIAYNLLILTLMIIIFGLINTNLTNVDEWVGNNAPNEKSSYLDRLFNMIYFSSTTFSTVGYGDIYPKSKRAKILVMLQHIIILAGLIRIFVKKNKYNIK